MIRLQKILSAAGIASRRAAEELIRQGRVTVNGRSVTKLGTKADPARDDIRVDGRRVKRAEPHRYLLLNKPKGYVTTRVDPQRRPTVLDLVASVREYIYPVGRLDFDSTGLLLLTNDGDLAAQLTHPRHGIEREYHAWVLGVPDDHDIERIRRGVTLDGRRTGPARVAVLHQGRGRRAGQTLISMTIREGRHRQVRRMCDAIGHPVTDLERVRIGTVADRTLKPGQFRELRPRELEQLIRAASRDRQDDNAERGEQSKRRDRRDRRDRREVSTPRPPRDE